MKTAFQPLSAFMTANNGNNTISTYDSYHAFSSDYHTSVTVSLLVARYHSRSKYFLQTGVSFITPGSRLITTETFTNLTKREALLNHLAEFAASGGSPVATVTMPYLYNETPINDTVLHPAWRDAVSFHRCRIRGRTKCVSVAILAEHGRQDALERNTVGTPARLRRRAQQYCVLAPTPSGQWLVPERG